MYDIYDVETSLSTNQQRPRKAASSSCPSWNEGSVVELLAAVKETGMPAESLHKDDWEKVAEQLSPQRSWRSCRQKFKALESRGEANSQQASEPKRESGAESISFRF